MKILLLLLIISSTLSAQLYTKSDSIRGQLSLERTCFDVHYYDLDFEVDIPEKSISGVNLMKARIQSNTSKIQLDLFSQMKIDSAKYKGTSLDIERLEDAFYLTFNDLLLKGSELELQLYFSGIPIEALNAPWDGGFVWKEDEKGNPWIGTAVQGIGASLFWPCKDHLSDEPDSMRVSLTVPDSLTFVCNGNKEYETAVTDSTNKIGWKISYPINTYNISLNIGDYTHFKDSYRSEDGEELSLDYYVLKYNETKAKEQFKEVKPMLSHYEKYLGKYPFWEDGYALVETSYLGMEHQSAVAYGNNYLPGYRGVFYNGFEFDYIIIHETGHEYWGNSVSMNDIADMWIHEGFCTYSEAIYVEARYGYEKALKYMLQHRKKIRNDRPVQGERDVNSSGSSDMYYKGAWMLHSLRHTVDNDSLWWSTIKGLAEEFRMSTVDRKDIEEYLSVNLKMDLTAFFNVFLDQTEAPILEFTVKKKRKDILLEYRWNTSNKNFNMPIKIKKDENEISLEPSYLWKTIRIEDMVASELKFLECYHYFKLSEKK